MAKTFEISEEEFLANKTLRDTVAQMLAHPKAGILAEQAMKEINPNAKTPRLDNLKATTAPVDEVRKEFEDFKKQQADKEAETEKNKRLAALDANIETGLSQLRRDGWTDEGIAGVRKIMEEKGIVDTEIAAAYFEKQHPPQNVVTPGGSGAWNFMDQPGDSGADEDLKKLIESKGEDNLLADKMANKALQDIRTQARR